MFNIGHREKEIIILKTLNGPITLNITRSSMGNIKLSIHAPGDVMIYREDFSTCETLVNRHLNTA